MRSLSSESDLVDCEMARIKQFRHCGGLRVRRNGVSIFLSNLSTVAMAYSLSTVQSDQSL